LEPEDVAQRYSQRPGYALISYAEVGLPFYRLTLRAQVLEHKQISPLTEFLLRSVEIGVEEPTNIGALLGLDGSVLDATVVSALRNDDIRLGAPAQKRALLTLTQKGRRSLETAMAIAPSETLIEIHYDGLLRRPVPFLDSWLTGIDLRERGSREVPPAVVRPPGLANIELRDVDPIVRALGDRRHTRRDLLALKSLEGRKRIFQLAVALVYRAEDDGKVQVAFAIDGTLSAEHERAFSQSKMLRKLGIGAGGLEPAEVTLSNILGAEIIEEAARNRPFTVVLPATSADLLAESSVEAIASPPALQIPANQVLPVETFQHPGYLQTGLANASSRLLIISPWVRRPVVNRGFISQLRAALARGVTIYVGWGFGPLEQIDEDIDSEVKSDFHSLQRKFPTSFFARRLGNTHAKVLICDREFMVVTSFNWLSFKGDPNRTFRDERGIFVSVPDHVERQFAEWTIRFEDAAPRTGSPNGANRSSRILQPTGPARIRQSGSGVEVQWSEIPLATRVQIEVIDASGAYIWEGDAGAKAGCQTIDELRQFQQPLTVTLTPRDAAGRVLSRVRCVPIALR
jgi:hypothetical protein